MPDPATLSQIVTALSILAKIADSLGVGGILLLALAGPLIVVLAVIYLSHCNNRRLSVITEANRRDVDRRFEEYRKDSDQRFDEFRRVMADTVDRYGKALSETRQYYKDNVELVRHWERMAKDFAEVISLNTRTQQKLVDRIEHNQFCPLVKEKSRP